MCISVIDRWNTISRCLLRPKRAGGNTASQSSPLCSCSTHRRLGWAAWVHQWHCFCGEGRLPGSGLCRSCCSTHSCLFARAAGPRAAGSWLLPSPVTFLSLLQCVIRGHFTFLLDLKIQFLSCLHYYRQYMMYLRGILVGRWTLPGMERWDQVISAFDAIFLQTFHQKACYFRRVLQFLS